ncbi:prominin, putative [Pediculus humanus corporis]|uniref:Prominin, putative n=1 Tax=Pediculus humanus subsp. corporis TaxID=121224 RepID=E0VGJ4_PEDHC|nr:prominin, putative [Pediculus humanus corporis]EEB12500.1 prominin, putative [Pediculus humanus corporis]
MRLIQVNGNTITIGDIEENWLFWLQHYVAIAVVVAIGLAFAVLMPIVALFFCCCRCGGKCGARPKHEKHNDSCKRTTVSILLGGVAVIILFGVVCAFVTNEHMKEGIEQLPEKVSTNLVDTKLYLDNTKKEVNHLLVINYQELKNHLGHRIDDAGEIVKNQLAVVSHAVALSNLTNLVSGMEIIKNDLASIQKSTEKLQELALTLGDYLDVTRDELLQELYNCKDIAACRELLNHHQVAELKVVENFNGLPDVANTFVTISRLLGDHESFDSIQKRVLEGQKNFNNIKYEISESLKDVKPDFIRGFETTETKLNEINIKIQNSLDNMKSLVEDFNKGPVAQAKQYIDEYAIYRYYLGLGVSGVLLLILLCLTFGLLCGICGKRPEEMYSDDGDCCNTVSGARFLMLAVWLIFLFSSVLMVITLAHFLLGMATEIAVCQPLKSPTDNKVFGLVDEFVNLESLNEGQRGDLKLSELKNVVNIEEVLEHLDEYQIQQKVNQFKSKIKVRTDKLELLTPDAKAKLKALADSSLNDINFDKYTQLLSYELRTNAEKIPDHASSGFDLTKIKKLLRAKAQFLDLLQRDSVAQIRNEILNLKSNVSTLKEHLKFNHTSLRDALDNLLYEVDRAQLYLMKNGTTELKSLLDEFVHQTQEKMRDYLKRVVNKTENSIGKSGPVSNAEYLYDAYADRDNMPLAMTQIDKKKKKNHHNKNYQDNFESGSNAPYLQDYSAHLGRSDRSSSANNEARYNDMAPKHWNDYSNSRGGSNGPPRYHHPSSTEYERPPPYYYPGP